MADATMNSTVVDDVDEKDFLIILGENIATQRVGKGLTQADLAGKLGVSQPLISAIEAGRVKVTPGTLLKITQILGTTFEALSVKKKRTVARVKIPTEYLDWLEEFEASKTSLPKKLRLILREFTNPKNLVSIVEEEFVESVCPNQTNASDVSQPGLSPQAQAQKS
jgi:transcriptional regulator with XRE-family HTH domain